MGKRERLAKIAAGVGLTPVLEAAARRPSLVVLNYHRIGYPEQCPYDPALFSATPEAFAEQIAYFKRRFRVVSLAEAVDVVAHGTKEPALLITFDDGYIDNHNLAFPILRAHSVPATFFVATSFMSTNRVPWWDNIAHMLRHSSTLHPQITYPKPLQVDLSNFRLALKQILLAYKSPTMRNPERFLLQVSQATGVELLREAPEPLFMSWEQVREMAQGGMDIGSHTHRHEILSALPAEEQESDLIVSKAAILQHAATPVETLAFPVGKKESFSQETRQALERTGYVAAFSFYGGVNLPGHIDRYDIRRMPVIADESIQSLRWRLNSSLLLNRLN